MLASSAPAASLATLTWNASTDRDLAGYKINQATASGGYGAPIATGRHRWLHCLAPCLTVGTTYFFVITAYDQAGNEGNFSNEVSKSIF